MPRGYLKHNKGISRKEARGGSSHSSSSSFKEALSTIADVCTEDFTLRPSSTNIKSRHDPSNIVYPVAECAICFQEGPVLCLSRKCNWHAAACHKCLRRVYVTDAQKSVQNYPLSCFHPLCDQSIQASQLKKHDLFVSSEQVKKHHEMLILSKIQSTDGMRTVHCPKCKTPRGITKFDKDRKYGCNNCKVGYQVTPDYATIRCLENMNGDDFGYNDGWAKCPKCSILISKGDGCDHMVCGYCNHDFSWEKAKESFGRLARPPDEEIYLWWK